jgi:hypothetical protein
VSVGYSWVAVLSVGSEGQRHTHLLDFVNGLTLTDKLASDKVAAATLVQTPPRRMMANRAAAA